MPLQMVVPQARIPADFDDQAELEVVNLIKNSYIRPNSKQLGIYSHKCNIYWSHFDNRD